MHISAADSGKNVASTPGKARVGACLAGVILATVAARAVYLYLGVRFASETPVYGPQFIDPSLLRSRLLESVLHFREQPPLFNLLVGLILKAFPDHSTIAFHVFFLGCGLLLAVSLFLLTVRMGVPPLLGAVVAAFFAVYPTTILYESYLYPTYLVATLLCLSALFLHRFLTARKSRDGFLFFTLLALLVLTRGTFHLFWLMAIAAAIFVIVPTNRRQVVLVSLLPIVVVLCHYVSNYVLFGSFTTGRWTLSVNLHTMTVGQLSQEELKELLQRGKLSPMSGVNVWNEEEAFALVPSCYKAKTGIPVLDEKGKPSGSSFYPGGTSNYNYHEWDYVCGLLYKDCIYVLKLHPKRYLRFIWTNNIKGHFFDPAADFFFSEWDQEPVLRKNARVVERALGMSHLQAAWFNWLVLPACLVFAVLAGAKWLLGRFRRPGRSVPPHPDALNPRSIATGFTLLFCLLNVVYASAVGLAVIPCDHNRYRFEVMPFFYLFCALLVWRLWTWPITISRGKEPRSFSLSGWFRAGASPRLVGGLGVMLGLAIGLDVGTASAAFERYYNLRSGAPGIYRRIGAWYRDPEAVPENSCRPLIDALQDPDARVRWESAVTLGSLGPEAREAGPALIGALQDQDEVVRRAAATSLEQIAPDGAIPALVGALGDSDNGVRRVAAIALGRLGARDQDTVAALSGALQDGNVGVRLAAAASLEQMGPAAKDAVPALMQAVQNAEPEVRAAAASALAAIGPEARDAVPALSELLKDEALRPAAAAALGAIGPEAKAAVPALLELWHGSNAEAREQAAAALRSIAPEVLDKAQEP